MLRFETTNLKPMSKVTHPFVEGRKTNESQCPVLMYFFGYFRRDGESQKFLDQFESRNKTLRNILLKKEKNAVYVAVIYLIKV